MSIFPFIDPAGTSADSEDKLPVLKEYAYDFEKNELLLDENGRTYLVEGNEALRIWIMKALITERYHYTAYDAAFGVEIRRLTGYALESDILRLEMERYIIEALMVNPYIRRLDNFVFEGAGTKLSVSFDCTSVFGLDKITVPIREVTL